MSVTDAILAFSEKQLLSISLLIILVKCESIMFAKSLIMLGGNLSGPVGVFLFMSLIIFSISSAVACGKSKVVFGF